MSLNPERHNFKVWRGTTFRRILEVWNDEAETSPYDFSGYTGTMTIREKLAGSVVGTVGVNFSGNQIELVASAATTGTWAWKQGVYELQITAPDGDVDVLLFGTVTIQDVS